MIQKIKGLIEIREHIDDIEKSFNNHKTEISSSNSELREELKKVSSELNEIKNNQKEFLKAFREDLAVIRDLRKDFAEEMYEFKLLKNQMQKKILESFEDELKKELRINIDSLRKENEEYSSLKKKFSEMSLIFDNMTNEANKFLSISSNIDKKDFEMTKFARELIKMDNEKLNLMKKVDSLQKLVGKMRRSR